MPANAARDRLSEAQFVHDAQDADDSDGVAGHRPEPAPALRRRTTTHHFHALQPIYAQRLRLCPASGQPSADPVEIDRRLIARITLGPCVNVSVELAGFGAVAIAVRTHDRSGTERKAEAPSLRKERHLFSSHSDQLLERYRLWGRRNWRRVRLVRWR